MLILLYKLGDYTQLYLYNEKLQTQGLFCYKSVNPY